jgi:hypothetical protein
LEYKNLKNGKVVIGNRYKCFKNGIGIGLNLPFDKNYLVKYVPIDKRKIYCGKENMLPVGYDLLGSNYMCHTKGIGVGKALKAKKHISKSKSKKSKKRKSRKSKKSKSRKSKKSKKRKSKKRKSRK